MRKAASVKGVNGSWREVIIFISVEGSFWFVLQENSRDTSTEPKEIQNFFRENIIALTSGIAQKYLFEFVHRKVVIFFLSPLTYSYNIQVHVDKAVFNFVSLLFCDC